MVINDKHLPLKQEWIKVIPLKMVALASIFSNFAQLEVISHTKPADLQQICFTKNSLTADYFIVCKVCFQSVADAPAFIIRKDVFLQMINRWKTDLHVICKVCRIFKPSLAHVFINLKQLRLPGQAHSLFCQ